MAMTSVAARAEVNVTITTDKPEFAVGEGIDFHITATNTSPEPALLTFTGTQAMYMVMEKLVYSYPLNNNGAPTGADQTLLLPGNGSHTWTFRHRYQAYEFSLGEHEVVGRVNAVGLTTSQPLKFRITDPPLPTKSYTLNFETIPGTNKPIKELEEYQAWCVRFKIIKSPVGDLTLTKVAGDNWCLAATRANLPTGYNIAADLSCATNAIAADVSVRPGCMIKMIARDEHGDVLAEATTPEFTNADRGKFKPITVEVKEKDKWIRSIEFWPSDPTAQVMIDNLAFTVPPLEP